MSKTRKILSIVLAVVLVVALAVPAFAIDNTHYEADDNTYSQEWSLSAPQATANANEYTIAVSLKTNYKTGPIEFVLDLDGVTLTDVAVGDAFYKDEYTYPSKSVETGTVMLSVNTKGAEYIEAKTIEGVIAVLTVTGTSGTVGIVDEPKNKDNPGGTLIAARVDNGDYVSGTLYIGQNTVKVGDAVTIGAAEAPTLVVKSGKAGVIDKSITTLHDEFGGSEEITGVIYGVEVLDGEIINDVFAVEEGGEIRELKAAEIVANENGNNKATGTRIEVLDATDAVVETYVFILFGDVDGNGIIDLADFAVIESHVINIYDDGDDGDGLIDSEVLLKAGDIDNNGTVDLADASIIESHVINIYDDGDDGDGLIQQSEIIAKFGE